MQKASEDSRKQKPMFRGLLAYFPDALMEVAHTSQIGNDQHHTDKPLHWDRDKSSDHEDAAIRHFTDRARGEVFDTDNARHLAKAAWRALAALQLEIERERGIL